ncbi:DUF6115 domain-containing protein [Neobacillus vireti]|uniref:DUF2802 domain-containing protein n=1 Tax=Neobacillus vireti LMG 21834 TaxID=1131730 RepID=A0AB94IM14_9BACI|nr:hypothetical protein [Neobacillus vireti]ETI68107.1 hypothetical protein BAVI_14194 [Neobacillus vireti LMG 21834]
MQKYVIEILLGLNLIGVIYLAIRVSFNNKFDPQQKLHQKINDNQKQITREITELKIALNHLHKTFQQESEQWRSERQALEASIKAARKSNIGQNLLLNDRYKEIFDLQAQGFSVDQIAKKLEKGSGEVAFILQLAAQART